MALPTSDIENLAGRLTKSSDPTLTMLIAVVINIDASGQAGRVQTDISGDAWLPADRDAQLSLGDRVWVLKQGGVFLVAGRLVGAVSGTLVKHKPSTESVTSSTTLQNDDDLFIDLTPGMWRIELFAHAACTVAADTVDILSAWSNTGTMTSWARSCMGPGPSSVNTYGDSAAAGSGIMHFNGHALGSSILYGITDDGSSIIHEDLLLEVAAAGRLQWKWAQNASNATPVTVSAAGRIYVTRMVTQ